MVVCASHDIVSHEITIQLRKPLALVVVGYPIPGREKRRICVHYNVKFVHWSGMGSKWSYTRKRCRFRKDPSRRFCVDANQTPVRLAYVHFYRLIEVLLITLHCSRLLSRKEHASKCMSDLADVSK
jgi:hypothetical protein